MGKKLVIIGLILILLIAITEFFCSYAFAEENLVDFVKGEAEHTKKSPKNNENTKLIPGFTEDNKRKIEKDLNSIEVGPSINDLKNKGVDLRDEEYKNNPDGTIGFMVEATSKERVGGYEHYSELEMFKVADEYMEDPVSQMSSIDERSCKEQLNNKKAGFVRKEKKVEIIDEIEELKSCEAPLRLFKCMKSLEVSCKKTTECDYGGITKGKMDEGIIFDSSNGYLTIGTDGDNYFKGTCATFDKKVTFSMAEVHLVTHFHLKHVKFDDYLQITLNGHIVYVGPDGGSHVEVKNKAHTNFLGTYYKKKVFNGSEYKNCERDTSWNKKVDIDLRKYLKEGENTLEMKIIVSGYGEGWLKIRAQKQCCASNDWTKKWVEHCDQRN